MLLFQMNYDQNRKIFTDTNIVFVRISNFIQQNWHKYIIFSIFQHKSA